MSIRADLDFESASEAELQAYAAALIDADDRSFLAAAARAHALYAAIYGTCDAQADEDPGILAGCPLWPVTGCFELGALGTAVRDGEVT